MTGEAESTREFFDAAGVIQRIAQGSISGPWESVAIVARRSGPDRPTAQLYGCPTGTWQLVTAELGAAYALLARAFGIVGDRWSVALTSQVRARQPKFEANFSVGGSDRQEQDFATALWDLDCTAVLRARLGLGPGSMSREVIDAEMVRAPGDPNVPAAAIDTVAGASHRRAARGIPYFVARVTWEFTDRSYVAFYGDLREPVDRTKYACGSGLGAAAARELAELLHPLGRPQCLYLLVAGTKPDDLRVRATRDGEAAIRFLHVTEHARLEALGLLPKRVRRPKGWLGWDVPPTDG